MPTPEKDLLTIHQNRLDEDCANQPKLMYEWGQALARARNKTAVAKNNLKLVWAELDQEIRADPPQEKLTEKMVECLILTNQLYKDALQLHMTAEYQENVLDAFVKALQDRKDELSNLVKLFGQMYWSRPDTQPKDEDRVARMKPTGKKIGNR